MDEAVICVKCGCSVAPAQTAKTTQPAKAEAAPAEVDNSVSAGLVILSVLIPLFGVIYWPVKAKIRPKCAQICGIAGIISWVVSFLMLMMMEM